MADQYDMSGVHSANLKILKEVDRICRKYKIRYGLDAGTLIGAVRHHGFIPWDDDADVYFTRSQYEAFCKVAPRELPEGMELLEPDKLRGGKAFYDFTPRIIYHNSRRHGDTPEMAYYEGRLGHRYHLDFKKYSLPHKIFVGGLAAVGRLIPMRAIFAMQRAVALKDRHSKGNLRYYSNYQPDFLYVTVEKDWCDQVVDMDFEDTRLMAPAGWHEILTEVYGDYMTPPPKEQQVPTHSGREIEVFG